MESSTADAQIGRLLLKAFEGLEPQERAAVLESLVGRALSPSAAPTFFRVPRPPEPPAWEAAFAAPGGWAGPVGEQRMPVGEQRMFPVRLPERDHARLKAWCLRHDFPMAVVVRGLIERFLDRQDQAEPGA
jgi:hypothetical protein